MTSPVIQTSFNAGEWAPALNARVDLQKYHSGAALLRNFFVDYRGGATTRPGSQYILQCRSSTPNGVRLIPFEASSIVTYILEFGNQYLRFFNNGAAVLETAVTGGTAASGHTFTIANTYTVGDWVLASGWGGLTNVNGNYFIVAAGTTGSVVVVTDLNGNTVTFTGAYTSGGQLQRVYTIASPYLTNELAGIKYSQNVNTLVLCHPNHPPYILTLVTATSWTLAPIVFGSTITAPSAGAATTLTTGTVNYAYVVTAVDINGQESARSTFATLSNFADIRSTPGTNTITWVAITGAISYNVYRAEPCYTNPVPSGSAFGFIGNCTGTAFIDSNITPDFSITPPLTQNPFSGASVQNITLTANGLNYPSIPFMSFTAAPAGGVTAQALAVMSVLNSFLNTSGSGYAVGDIVNFSFGVVAHVTALSSFSGTVSAYVLTSIGAVTGPGTALSSGLGQVSTTGAGTGFSISVDWAVASAILTNPGAGYIATPSITFSSGAAAATATLGAGSAGNPTVPGYFQQRLVLAGPVSNPQLFNMSQPGSFFNFNTSDPIQADDAITATLVSGKLNTIRSMVSMPTGLIMLSDKQAWLINGGAPSAPISALAIVANSQAYNGSADLPPIIANYDILYVQSKGSIVRDLTYNFYTNIYTGTDISILSSHLFFGFSLIQWAWAEEPFKIAWAVRNDGTMLMLTFLKEQELIAWAHADTQGLYSSVAIVTEPSNTSGTTDAVYTIVQRTINGISVNYIERFVELHYPADYKSSWQVDAGIGYNGAPASTFSGAQHLAGQPVTGVADGAVINFTMPLSGTFVFGPGGTPGLTGIASASIVTVGLSFLPQLQTLRLDLGEPTSQGKRKKIAAVTVRCKDALGLFIGNTFNTLVAMKDLVLGNVGTMSNKPVTGLVTEDARTIIDPNWTVQGQVCIQQNNPYPASILGVIPEIEVGDTTK